MKNKSLSHWVEKIPEPIEGEFSNLCYQNQLQEIFSKTIVSPLELEALTLPTRYSALDIAKKIRVPLKSNVLEEIDLKYTPYLIEPISLIGDDICNYIIIIAPTQSGKTVFLQVAVADTISQNPGTTLIIFPNEKDGKAALEEKYIGMIEESEFLHEYILFPKKTNLSTTKIKLKNMTIWPAWSGSLGSMSSKAVRVIIIDEIRLMKKVIGKESNAIQLAEDRLTTFKAFGQGQFYGVSTPAEEGDLLHGQTTANDILVLFRMLCCQNCGKYYKPNYFKHVLPNLDKYNLSFVTCPFCKEKQQEGRLKVDLNRNSGYGIPKEHHGKLSLPPIKDLRQEKMLFWYDSISSPFRTIKEINKKYRSTKPKIENYKNFIQGWLAMFWKQNVSITTEEILKKRKKKGHRRGNVPLGVKFLTAGVDAQDAGFYVTISGWVNSKISYLVDHYFIKCHKDTTTPERTKTTLDKRLNSRKWGKWMVSLWGIDIADGDRTDELREATADFDRCINIIGAPITQVTNIVYYEKLNYYRIKRHSYLDETDIWASTDGNYLPEDVEQDFLTQFPNAQKIKEIKEKDGSDIITWKKIGQNDYRMAKVYDTEMLDIEIDNFTLRDTLDDESFTYNPGIIFTKDSSEKDESTNLGSSKNEDDGYEEVENPYSDFLDIK